MSLDILLPILLGYTALGGPYSTAHVAEKTDRNQFALSGKLCEAVTAVGAIHESPARYAPAFRTIPGEPAPHPRRGGYHVKPANLL